MQHEVNLALSVICLSDHGKNGPMLIFQGFFFLLWPIAILETYKGRDGEFQNIWCLRKDQILDNCNHKTYSLKVFFVNVIF